MPISYLDRHGEVIGWSSIFYWNSSQSRRGRNGWSLEDWGNSEVTSGRTL